MKANIKNLSLLPAVLAVLNLLPAGRVTAQTFTTLHCFNYSDGANPNGLILTNNSLYGTAQSGGNTSGSGGNYSGNGTVFAVSTDGTGFTNLHKFAAGSFQYLESNSDGANPNGLILSGTTLYATTSEGTPNGQGTLFAVNTDGTGFTNLYNFGFSDVVFPEAGLLLSGNTLYSTAMSGGSFGRGTVFAVHTDGSMFTNLYSFTATTGPYPYTNSDGASPQAGLILSGSTLYGTATYGGCSGGGSVFAVHTDGTGFTNLHSFLAATYNGLSSYTNSGGANPYAGLILSGNTLYGTAQQGSTSGNGTVFAVNTDGTGFTNLHNFTATGAYPYPTNSDGAYPRAGLILSGSTLYGTAQGGGSSGYGTVFAVHTNGTGFTNLHTFADGDGAGPQAGLILSGNTLYGTASQGGSSGNGTVFSLSFRPQLTIAPSGTNVILSWPTNVAGFDYTGYTLQSTTNLVSPVVWSSNSPAPVVLNGQNTLTNPITGAQQFYRLIQ